MPYWPAHVVPYTPAGRLPKGKHDPGFRTKPQQAAALVQAARTAGVASRAVVADCFYGDNVGFTEALGGAEAAYVPAVKPRKGAWAPAARCTPRRRRPASWPGEARKTPGTGPRSPVGLGQAADRPRSGPTTCDQPCPVNLCSRRLRTQ